MRKLPIDIQEIADAMDTQSEAMTLYLDTASGKVVAHFLEDDEDNEEIDLDDTISLHIPSQDSHEGYRWMAEFVDQLKDQKLAHSLEKAMRGKGPFRRFKDVLSGDPHQLKRWYDYRQQRLVKSALDWLRANDIEPLEMDDELLAQPDCGETMRTAQGRSILPADDGPGIDPHLGKPAVRTVVDRLRGKLVSDGQSWRLESVDGRQLDAASLEDIFQAHAGFQAEITLYEDHDPNVGFRIGEALDGLGTFVWEGPSVYLARIRHELLQAFADREYLARLDAETILVSRRRHGKQNQRFLLCSPKLGKWILEHWNDALRNWEMLSKNLTFRQALTEMVKVESRQPSA